MCSSDLHNIQINLYTDTYLYKNINSSNKNQLIFFKKVVNAYENFIEFLRNDKITIDHTYLWDIISMPNELLFPHGLNLVIMELTDNDITDNINVLCPTNHYSNEFYNTNRKTLLLIKSNNYFEPIFSLVDVKTKYNITTLFDLKSKIFLPNVTRVLNAIKNSVNEKCGPMPSMPKIYKFKQNIVLDKVIKLLLKQKYEILSQILNYNGKIIGITARKGSRIGYVPVYPSSPSNLDGMEDLVYKYMDDDDIWTNYADTIQFLNMVHNDTGGKIPCSPKIKVIDDGMVVGLLTDANQFVALNNPANNDNSDDLDVVDNASYLLPDQNIDNSNIDKERIEYKIGRAHV